MKHKILSLAILACSITIVACSKDSTTGPGTTQADSNFFPLKIGNYWVYKTPDSTATRYVKGTFSHDGKSYFEIYDYSDASSSYNRKDGSKLYSLFPTDLTGTVLKEVEILDEKVGATWSYDLAILGSQHFAYTTVETGLTRTTNGTQYTNVLHVHLKATGDALGFPIDEDDDIYYSKNIGEIERTGSKAGMLRSYHVN